MLHDLADDVDVIELLVAEVSEGEILPRELQRDVAGDLAVLFLRKDVSLLDRKGRGLRRYLGRQAEETVDSFRLGDGPGEVPPPCR